MAERKYSATNYQGTSYTGKYRRLAKISKLDEQLRNIKMEGLLFGGAILLFGLIFYIFDLQRAGDFFWARTLGYGIISIFVIILLVLFFLLFIAITKK